MSDSAAARPSILVVDDDEPFRTVLSRALRARGFDAEHAAGYDEAVERVRSEPPVFAVVDLSMPGRSGLEIIEAIKTIHPSTIVVAVTEERSPAAMAEARRRGATFYLNKPVDADEIVATLRAAATPGR